MVTLKKLLAATSMVALFALTSCQTNSPVDLNELDLEDEALIQSEFAEFDTNDESPGFGDAEILGKFGGDVSAEDPVVQETDVANAIENDESDGVPTYFVRLNWGMLEGDSTVTTTTDFSGALSVNKGVLAVLKKIRFEPNDHIVRPRPNRQTVEFVSTTSVHFDGLAIAIIDNAETDEEGVLTVQVGEYNNTFTFSELAEMELREPVGADGNEISIVSTLRDVSVGQTGFFEGRWIRTGDNHGKFEGRWISKDGDVVGHYKGRYGVNADGHRVFAGKFIDRTGTFMGRMAGTWGFSETNDRRGWLSGRWVDRSNKEIGKLRGHWKVSRNNKRGGHMAGRWAQANIESSDEG